MDHLLLAESETWTSCPHKPSSIRSSSLSPRAIVHQISPSHPAFQFEIRLKFDVLLLRSQLIILSFRFMKSPDCYIFLD
ncbi:hypothetical protein AALP_AA7G120600 [Arabis alpina]|uniref:Uncharacterized protein n=1 Tax=Arabis alpina TaxID=50452 RepID=A0A087GHI4_ARAAL|nr:hypothetical protein AALP_AA7G120600 [Arabis alpina]